MRWNTLLKINKRNKEISLNQICEKIQNLEIYAGIVADMQKIVTSIPNPFKQLKEHKAYEQCKTIYNVLSGEPYTVNDLYFATEYLIQISKENIIKTVKEREIFNKTIELLVDICSQILKSKIEVSDLRIHCHTQVLAVELVLRLNQDIIKSKIYYTQKEVEYLFTHRYLPSVIYEFRQFQGVEQKVSSSWIGQKLREITDLDSEIISVGRKNYLSINAIKELEKRICSVSDSLEILSSLEVEIIALENKISEKQKLITNLKVGNDNWQNKVEEYFQNPTNLLYQVIFVDFYIQLIINIIIQSCSLPLTVDEIFVQLNYQFQKETGFKDYLKNNELILRKTASKLHKFTESISEGVISENILDEFSKIKNLLEIKQSISNLNSTHSEINLYKLARNNEVLGNDYYGYYDLLRNTLSGSKCYFNKVVSQHIDSIENNLLYLQQELSMQKFTYTAIDEYFNKK